MAQEKLAVFRGLLREKRRIWGQTARDYKRKMITRLDLLAAKSDWMAARSREPALVRVLARADAALRAFFPMEGELILAAPPPLSGGGAAARSFYKEADHPSFRALAAQRAALLREREGVVEQNRADLDLSFNLGLYRYHDTYDPALQRTDVTDLNAKLGVRYLFPIKRPDTKLKLRLNRLARQVLGEKRDELRRSILSQVDQSEALVRHSAHAIRLIQDQLKVARRQISAAYAEYRNGKLEFQNFLDHWEPYQQAQLRLWDARRTMWLAEADQILLLNRRPLFCGGTFVPSEAVELDSPAWVDQELEEEAYKYVGKRAGAGGAKKARRRRGKGKTRRRKKRAEGKQR